MDYIAARLIELLQSFRHLLSATRLFLTVFHSNYHMKEVTKPRITDGKEYFNSILEL
jgi:hypothetical protein